MRTTKPRRPHADAVAIYGFVLGDLLREENAAALFFPKLREASIRAKLANRAAGLKYDPQADEVEAAIMRRVAGDPRALLMWARRNPRSVRKMIRAAQNETPAKGCNPAGVGITIHQDRNEREQHSANAG